MAANNRRTLFCRLLDDLGVTLRVRALVFANLAANQLVANLFADLLERSRSQPKALAFFR